MKNEAKPNATLTVRDFKVSTIHHTLTQQYYWHGDPTPSILKGQRVPKRSKVRKRPDDVIVKALTGAGAEDSPADDGKDKAAQSLGQRGGRGRAKSLTKEQRTRS